MNPLHALVRLIYPPKCSICEAFIEEHDDPYAGEYPHFCPGCAAGWKPLRPPLCTICGRPFPPGNHDDHPCEPCTRKPPHFEALRAPFIYEENFKQAVHRFKYQGQEHLAKPLGRLLADYAVQWLGCAPACLLVPVPLHPRRLRERGYNQSLLLARKVARRVDADLDFLNLRRVRYTEPQAALGHADRRRNVRDAFLVKKPDAFKGRLVVLVDDVATTGHTLNECARVLRKAGAERVMALTLARAML